MALPPLSAAQELAALRVRYPAGLICTSPEPCPHRLLATTPAGYSKSGRDQDGNPCPLPEAERLMFVCAHCRQAAVERAQLAALRAELGRQNIAAAHAARAARKAAESVIGTPDGHFPTSSSMSVLDVPDFPGVEGEGSDDGRATQNQGHHGHRGGRPRVHRDDRARQAAAARAYRARKRQAAVEVRP